MAKSDHSDRTKAERIERLKQRLNKVADSPNRLLALTSVIKGLLDLLADEADEL